MGGGGSVGHFICFIGQRSFIQSNQQFEKIKILTVEEEESNCAVFFFFFFFFFCSPNLLLSLGYINV